MDKHNEISVPLKTGITAALEIYETHTHWQKFILHICCINRDTIQRAVIHRKTPVLSRNQTQSSIILHLMRNPSFLRIYYNVY
jgi:hypothetical protein